MLYINKKWTTIIEAIVVMVIIVLWVVWMYQLLWNSQALSIATKNRIIATQIAREWVEAVTNIRDTNWFLYSADYKNCWNVLNYQEDCIWDDWSSSDPDLDATTYDIKEWKSFKVYKNSDDRWILSETTSWWTYDQQSYKDDHKVYLDSNNFYTQDWTTDNLLPVYTREIKINYKDTNGDWTKDSEDEIMEIISLVQWSSWDSTKLHKVEIKTYLSNWKNKKD